MLSVELDTGTYVWSDFCVLGEDGGGINEFNFNVMSGCKHIHKYLLVCASLDFKRLIVGRNKANYLIFL